MRIIAPVTVAVGLLIEIWLDDHVLSEQLHHLLMAWILIVHARRLYKDSLPH